jgi:hypothetical protein
MVDTSNVTTGQPEEPSYARLLREDRRELERLRAVVLYEQSQRKLLLLDSLDEMERGLSRIIKDLDGLRSTLHIDNILLSIEDPQANIRKARQCLLIASSLLEPQKSPSLRRLEALFTKFEEFADLLYEAIKQLEAIEQLNI